MTEQRVLPHHPDLEDATIGAALLHPRLYTELAHQGLTAHDFYRPARAAVWNAARTLINEGLHPDIGLITDQLRLDGQTDLIPELLALQNRAPAPSGAPTWAAKIIDASHRRRVALHAQTVAQAALDGHDLEHPLELLAELGHAARLADADDTDPGPINVRHRLEHPPDEPPLLIDGFLRKGELSVVAAPRAIGKSWFTYNLATLLDRGDGLFLGKLAVRQKARVLICQGEIDDFGAYSRWRFLAGNGPPPDVEEWMERWRIEVDTETVRLNLPDGGQKTRTRTVAKVSPKLEHWISTLNIDVLVIDPWAVFYGGNENDKREVQAALDLLRDISDRTGIAIVIVHHFSQALEAREPEDLWRGSSRLADWASTRVTLVPHYKRESEWKKAGLTREQARRIVDIHFLRRSGAGDQFTIEWQPTTGWWDLKPDPAAPKPAPTKAKFNPVDVARQLDQAGGQWASIAIAADALGCSESTARTALERALASGHIVEARTGGRARTFQLPKVAPPTLPDPPAPQSEVELMYGTEHEYDDEEPDADDIW